MEDNRMVSFSLGGMAFEYDDNKNQINIKKHGISFKSAARIFFDYDRIEFYDEDHSYDEDRYNTIGDTSAGRISQKAEGALIGNMDQFIGKVNEILFVVYPYHADPERRMRVHCGGFLRHRSPCACMGGRGAVGAGCFLERERYSDVVVNAHQDARYNPMSDGVHERKEWIY